MRWIRTFLGILSGDALKDEAEKHRKAIEDAQEAARCARETLDGEHNWLWRRENGEKTCNVD